jgi:hypothetical protein
MPKSNIAIPHFEQVGRLIESECAVAGWYVVSGSLHIYFLAGVSDSQSTGRMPMGRSAMGHFNT